MAGRWRIRHKLMLGLGLVVGIMALVLAATLHGLMAYVTTVKSIQSKLSELLVAVELKSEVARLREVASQPNATQGRLGMQKAMAQKAVGHYTETLRHTLDRRRDPGKGRNEMECLLGFKEAFAALDRAIQDLPELRVEQMGGTEQPFLLAKDAPIYKPIQQLEQLANDLQGMINDDLWARIDEAKKHYEWSLILVLATSVLGVVLMAALLRFLYRWVCYPIRDLGQGVARVAQGDFEHRIEVNSGDEMEDLAAAFNDMTGRLREMYRDLAHQVNERSRQLIRSERLASVGFLAAGVAHEINNPLASIAFCSEALESRMAGFLARAPEDATTITKYLRLIQQEAFRCKAITQRLLEFSRSGERRREPTDLAELVQSVLDVVQHLQNSKGKQIVFQPGVRPRAWINAQEIKSVVLNLVVNALDSMDEHGTLTIDLGQRDGMAELVFADTGCGMTAEVLENIFEPFFTRSRTGKGTGLGLAISHRVITQHGGEIEAASAGPNAGSTFTVRLPLQPLGAGKEEMLGHAAA